jgi:hypothetical protein
MVEYTGSSSNGSGHNHVAQEHTSVTPSQTPPLYAQPQQDVQQAVPQPQQAGSTADAAVPQQHQQQHNVQPHPQQQPQQTAAASQGGTPWHRQPRSNVVEIDDVQVTPIDDPFYDPTNPSSNYDRSSEEATAAARAALKEASAGQRHPSNVVTIDEVDFEGFAAPLLEEAEAGAKHTD